MESPPKISTHILRGVIVVAEFKMIGKCVEVTTWFQRGTNSPFRSTGDEYAKGEVVGEKAVTDGNQQFCLAVFILAFIQTINKNGMWKCGEVQVCTFSKVLQQTHK